MPETGNWSSTWSAFSNTSAAANKFYITYPQAATTGSVPMQSETPEAPLAWLDRRIREVRDLVAA